MIATMLLGIKICGVNKDSFGSFPSVKKKKTYYTFFVENALLNRLTIENKFKILNVAIKNKCFGVLIFSVCVLY